MKNLKILEKLNDLAKRPISRKNFFKTSALLGTSAGVMSSCGELQKWLKEPAKFDYPLLKPENIIYTACLQCHNACSVKAKLYKGTLYKIDGNPYGPQNNLFNFNYDMPVFQAAHYDGKACPKGQAGIQTVYDPYRIRKVLKRAGKRGENKWVTIDFNKAIEEIVNGGNLFGEGHVKGLKDVWALRDPGLSKKMAEDAKKVGQGKMSVAAFKRKYKNHLDKLIDPDRPDLGPKNNGFVMLCGRIEHGRKEFGKRFTFNSFGSKNFFEHTTICEQSHHIAFNEITSEWHVEKGKGKWGHGKHHLKPDFVHSEFVIFFGTGAFEANFGKTAMAEKVTKALTERNFKMAVVDPRLSQTAAKAHWWLPVRPGGDAALAYAMIRWIFENEKYDKKFLANANKAAAKATGEKSYSDAPLLVVIENGRGARYLRASEVGLGSNTQFVVMQNGRPVAVDINDDKRPVTGDLFVDAVVGGKKVKSALQLVKEYAFSKTMQEWADISGCDLKKIKEVAKEFTSHGKKAAAELYRGPVQHANGYYAGMSIIYLNMLIGNIDWEGGMQGGGGHWHEDGSKNGPFNIKKSLHPGKLTAFGYPVSREKTKYEDTSFFRDDGYPAKRAWYPFTGNVYQEVIPSAAEGYPYKIDVLLLHKGTPALSIPGGHKNIPILMDTKKIPLFIACDIVIGETSMYADYIFPDITYLERWGTPHIPPSIPTKASKVRQPVVAPIPEIVKVEGEEMPISLEAFLLAVGQKLGLPGIGKDGFGKGMDFKRPEDFYLKLVANIANGDKPGDAVPEATDKEMDLFRKARKHLPKAVFDEAKWKKAIGNDEKLWRRVVTVLNHGGRFAEFKTGLNTPYVSKPIGRQMKFFIDHVATQKHSITGKYFSGLAIYDPIKQMDGKEVGTEKLGENEFYLNTYKEVFGGHSRTISNYWTQLSIKPENRIKINKVDADRLGLEDGDE
ncbi:MAG: molybdopterin oxidoreductase, partial [Candidatus Hydrogenedentota bacterium]